MLLPFLSRHNAQVYITPPILKIGINIDGLPIAKSSKSQLWPILISVINFKELRNYVIPIGIFHGFQKPHSIEEFLNPFIIDLLEIIDNGLTVNDTLFTLEVSNIYPVMPRQRPFYLMSKVITLILDVHLALKKGHTLNTA